MTATRTKRILSIQPVAERGGSDRALSRLVRSLAQDGWDCHIALPGPSPLAGEFEAAGATLHIVPMRRITTSGGAGYWLAYALGWPLAVGRLTALARRLHVDVVHTNSLHSWYGWAAAELCHLPHVWHAREIVVQSPAALTLERVLCRRFADVVIAASAAVAAQLDPANVEVCYDRVDPEEFSPARAGVFRAGAGLADDVPLVGMVGRIDTWKGLEVLLDAVPRLRHARPEVEVVVAGGTVAAKEHYARLLAERATGLGGVHWLGERDDPAEIIADLDVLAVPSTEPEPFGLSAVEALASGVPVAASAAGGPLEILGQPPGHRGALVPPGDPEALADALIRLLPDGPSSTASRKARTALEPALPQGDQVVVFDQVLETGLSGRRRRLGTRRRSRRRSAAS